MHEGHKGPRPLVPLLMCTLVASVTWPSSSLTSTSASASANRTVAEVLASVEQKLGFILQSQGGVHQLQYAVTQTGRRLDGIELRMARLEHKLDSKEDGVTAVAHSISAKMSMLEARSVVQTQNLQSKLDRTEANMLAALNERVSLVTATIDKLDKFLRDRSSDKTFTNISSGDDETIPCNLTEVKETAKDPWPSNSSSNHMVIVGEKRLQDLDSDIEIYTRKVMNTYHEVMKESRSIDTSLRQLQEQGNQTRLTVREAFRKLYQHTKPVSSLDEILRSLAKKVTELANTVDTSFKSLLVAQNTFIATCHRVQQQEPVVETRIYHLLHKLVQEFGNKSKATKEECSLRDSIDTHRKDVDRALQDLKWTVIAVGNRTVENLRKETTECDPSSLHQRQMDIDDIPTEMPKNASIGDSSENLNQTTTDDVTHETERKSSGTDVLPDSLSLDDDVDYNAGDGWTTTTTTTFSPTNITKTNNGSDGHN